MNLEEMSNEELDALMNQAAQEKNRRTAQQRLLDAAWAVVTDAKRAGYPKQAVVNALTDIVEQTYA